jgi:ribulose kinase
LTGALPEWIAEHQPEYVAAAVDRAIENTLNDAGAKAAGIVYLILDATESLAMARQTRAPLTLAAPAATPATDTRRPDRIGFTTAIAWIPHAAKTELRLLAVAEDKSAEMLIREALNLLFVNRGKPPLA